MFKSALILMLILGVVGGAYHSAQWKVSLQTDLEQLKLGMSASEVREAFGVPMAMNRNELVYILPDSSELSITLRDNAVTSAMLKYKTPVRVSDPRLKELTLVQMDPASTTSGKPNWFFAGKPEEGIIYKITAQGVIETVTWVPRFAYGAHRPKNVQVLLRDFNRRELSRM